MVTKAKPWPHNAQWARDETAERLWEIIQMLQPLIHNGSAFDRTETLRRQARALNAAQDGLRRLMEVGARVRD